MGSPLDSLDALMATIAPSASIGDLIQHGPAPGMAGAEPIPNAPVGMDPLSLLQLLSNDAAQRRTPAAGVPTIRPTTAPTKKSAPIVVAPGGETPATAPGKFDWPALIKLAAPILGSIANRGDHGAFMSAYLHAQEGADQEKALKEAAAQKLRDAGADYLLKIGEHAQGLTDPADFQNFLHLAEAAGVKAGYLQPGELTSQLTFPASKASAAKLKKLNDLLDAHEKAGYDLDALAKAGASLDLDGTEIPVRAAMDLTHRRPLDASGQPVVRPKKADVNAATAEERFLAKWAKEHGTTVDQLTSADELAARKEYAQSGRSPVDPEIAHMHKNLLQLQIDIARGNRDKNAAGGGLTDEGLEYAATQYRVTGAMPAMGMGGGQTRTSIINRAAEQAKNLGQSPAQAVQKQAAYKADGAALTKMRGMSSAAESFESKANQQADIVASLSAKVPRTNWPIINDALLAGKKEIAGDENTQLLYNAVATFTTEYAKIMEGSTGSAAASSDSARRAAERLIRPGLNPQTLQSTLTLMKREMQLTVDGYAATIDHISNRMGGAPAAPATPPPDAAGSGGLTYDDYLRSKGTKRP